MTRGEIWWVELPKPGRPRPRRERSAPSPRPRASVRRPVLIVQSDSFTESALHTVVVVVITSNIKLAAAPGNVRLSKGESGLSKAGVVNVAALATIDKRLMTERIGCLEPARMAEVEAGLKLVLGISRPEFVDPGEAPRRAAHRNAARAHHGRRQSQQIARDKT